MASLLESLLISLYHNSKAHILSLESLYSIHIISLLIILAIFFVYYNKHYASDVAIYNGSNVVYFKNRYVYHRQAGLATHACRCPDEHDG